MQQAREEARAEMESMLAATREFQATRAKEEAALKARHEQLEQRLHAAEKALLAADQRQAEMDDYEARLRFEVEEQERQLSLERQATEALRQKLQAEWQRLHEGAAQNHHAGRPLPPRRSDSHPGTTRFERHMRL
jgi:chromosome segregation ATPase